MLLHHPLEVMRLRNDPGIRSNVLGATYGEGVRRNVDGTSRGHQGWDLYAPEGTPIYAVADGEVAWTANGGDYGLQLLLRFNRESPMSGGTGTLFAFYAHLQETSVKKGDAVRSGMPVGLTGTSGNASKSYPHLHFEVRTTADRVAGLQGRVDPSTVLGAALLSCGSEEIGGVDTVKMVSVYRGAATPVSNR